MINMRYKPYYLPQVSAPYDIILQKLDEEGVMYELVEADPNELNPTQGIIFSDEVEKVNLDDMNPIWISDDNKVLDGHHRLGKAIDDDLKLKAVRIKLNEKDAIRILNKIQDIYEYEQARGIEEIETQDTINDENQVNSSVSQSEFLSSLEEMNVNLREDGKDKNPQTIIAYRKDPIRENSVVGNFFTLNPLNGFSKYEINFDNLLDTNALGVTYKDGQEPIDILAKSWFPNINFEKLGGEYKVPSINLKNKAVAEKAIMMGYDGIKYGDKIIQGLK